MYKRKQMQMQPQVAELSLSLEGRDLTTQPLVSSEIRTIYQYVQQSHTANSFIKSLQSRLPFTPVLSIKQLNVAASIMAQSYRHYCSANGLVAQYDATGTLRHVPAEPRATAQSVQAVAPVAPVQPIYQAAASIATLAPLDRYWGIYTVGLPDGDLTVRIKRDIVDTGYSPRLYMGQVQTGRVGYLAGPSNENDYRYCGSVLADGSVWLWKAHRGNARLTAAVQALAMDESARAAAGIAYAKESGSCYRCGRTLTVASSIDAGLGPICAGKVYL